MTTSEWDAHYDDREPLFNHLADMVAVLLRQQLDSESIKYLSVTYRVKDRPSFIEKIERKGYDDPSRQMTDFAGIRVVTYLPSQVDRICSVIDDLFEIDVANSSNKTDDLGTDKVGYQSQHFVCSLGRRRAKLPEYKDLHELKFEIQVRTILQHAWADLAHGKSYKFSNRFSSRLPPDLQRRLNLHAGTLELIDIGLNELSSAIDSYADSISASDATLLPEPVNAISLASYMEDRFPDIQPSGGRFFDTIVDEVRRFGLVTIQDFDKILTKEISKLIQSYIGKGNIGGTVRKILVAHDVDNYFTNAWGKEWTHMTSEMQEIIKARYGEKKLQQVFDVYAVNAE